MTVHGNERNAALADILADDLAALSEHSVRTDPSYRAALEDAQQMHEILDKLVKLRKALGLTQSDVAQRMGVRQPTVSSFENESSDPRLSTLQRYARAVEGRIHIGLAMPANCDWIARSDKSNYHGKALMNLASVKVVKGDLAARWAAADPAETHYGSFA